MLRPLLRLSRQPVGPSLAKRATMVTTSRKANIAELNVTEWKNEVPVNNIIHNHNNKTYTVLPITFWMDNITKKRSLVDSNIVLKDEDLEPKTMADSYIEAYLPLKSSPSLLDAYVGTDGNFRIGKIIEDFDALAGTISCKHTDAFLGGQPITVVTASVDRMELLMPNSIEDLKISGHVAYVGRSSMEVFVKLETVKNYSLEDLNNTSPPDNFLAKPTPNTILFARFTMVATSSATGKPTRVNALTLLNEEERELMAFAEDCKMRKKKATEISLNKVAPTSEEREALHEIYMNYSKYDKKEMAPENTCWMEDTKLQSVILMQPQNRNIHNNVFGGYLMRRALELAHATGTVFAKGNVGLMSSDEIVFKKPVPVGALLNLTSQVRYAEGGNHRSFQIDVTAEVTNIETGTTDVTNTFHFTFASKDKPVRQILPRTYVESILYLEGKRRRDNGVDAKKQLLELMKINQ
ncbi:HotDog domain-containing protein [Pilobolus umbonatus]|nr:HotDog domain-containing protein [Pilobolus umbonatus]